jgi:uncharacterized membrane protein
MEMPDTPTRESEGGNHMDGNHVDESRLLNHVFGTYNWLRFGMAVIAFAFPLLLLGVGWAYGVPFQGAMSAYYWASVEGDSPVRDLFDWASVKGDPPVRVLFVGGIFAIGSFLILYKGYSRLEDWLLNLAGLLVILVAWVPMSWKCGSELGYCSPWRWHSVFAIAFFACIVIVAIFLSGTTLHQMRRNPRHQRYFRIAYWFTRASLIILPALAILAHLLTRNWDKLTFSLELAGIWAFALFWFVKSLELRRSQAERQVREAVDQWNKRK